MQSIQLNIIGQSIQLVKRSADELRGLNMGEKLSLDFYNGNFRDTDLLFVKPKGANPTPRKCAIVSERLSQLFEMPVVFILAPAMTYERQRLMEKGVYFVMSEKYANLPMLVAMEKVSSRKIPSHLTPVAQYLLLYHLQVESIEGKSTKAIASLMPYSYESVSLGLTCLSDLGLCVKVALDSRSRAVSFKSRGKELWEAAEKYVVNPVERRVYCDALNSEREFPVCGINALAHYTALNPDAERWVMMTGKEFKDIDTDGSVLNPNEFDGNIIIEIWKYPRVCRKHDSEMYVDRLSLALSLRHDEDPRVEEEVEQLIKQVEMVGLDRFKEAFAEFSDNYVIIGGTACDIAMTGTAVRPRATHDIDMIVVVENMTPEFGKRFWDFIKEAGYRPERCKSEVGEPTKYELYRFVEGKPEYPEMIELLSRHPDVLGEPHGLVIEPLPIDGDMSSLSAIIMDDDFYHFTIANSTLTDGIRHASPVALIALKAKAYLNLLSDKARGLHVNTRNIKKHRSDVMKSVVIVEEDSVSAPSSVVQCVREFVAEIRNDYENLAPALAKALDAEPELVGQLLEQLEILFVEE